MAKAYKITEEISNEIRMIRKKIKNKSEDIRLHVVELRGLGKKNKEIAEILEIHEKVVSKWISIFSNQGTQGLMNKPKGENHRNMTFEQEEEFLKQFEERTKKGELLSTNEIKEAYIESVGHSIGHEQIYRVLKRHGYRKIMPRSRHPKKASDEEIEQSKKKLPIWCRKQK
jgi:transposase